MKRLLISACLLLPLFAHAANQKVVLDVQGMTCPLCVISVNQALRETEGVVKAKASLKTRQTEVIVAEGFPTETLLKAVAKTGYSAKLNHIEKL
ncbi:heavy metal-associated domain-containing protein [Leclercia adecarboxylata]|uniref:Heavy-metal-associated domain-containing protein n=1 Tax=Leclercia barmai TaxID=2785629 RepID=A0ABS7RS97_9ENTR|nr:MULTISPECIES: heavy metal-associated domain-containing protein [Enterobacteriaceae]MBZ0056738.1 heavy-metal-associated domain-containing protein [Leclercia sp. EMC7]MCM5694699.1 heavy-metal-associated domain-containing protein [Leclercia sp. LTM01]MCM5698919.1 heavy-metal-associated domain-containing protein [Leclercia sp. LTM14]QCZ25584.1 heavy-metal-associated domain-containing protein [Leclercia adecarboxylata]TLU69402.1 heavy-metal-associated domain-containing protein [Enterobacter sp. 